MAILIKRRSQANILVTIKDSTGTAIDITGYTAFSLRIAEAQNSATAFLSSTGTITDATNGKVNFPLTPAETETLTAGPMEYITDIKYVDAAAETIITEIERIKVSNPVVDA